MYNDRYCDGLNVCVSPAFISWGLNTNVTVFRGETFGKWTLVNGINSHIRRDRREMFSPLAVCGYSEKTGCVQTRKGDWAKNPVMLAWHSNLKFPASRTVINKCLFFKPPSLWYFLLWQQKLIKLEFHRLSLYYFLLCIVTETRLIEYFL